MDVAAPASTRGVLQPHHEGVHPAGDWYAAYLSARQNGRSPEEAALAAVLPLVERVK